MDHMQPDGSAQWLADSARQLDAAIDDNRLTLSGQAADGSASLCTLEEGLTMILTEVNAHAAISNLQLNLPEDYLFIKLYLPDCHLETVARSGFEYHQISAPGVLLYNSHLRLKSIFSVRQRFKIVSFAMHAGWLQQTFPLGSVFAGTEIFKKALFRFEQVSPAVLQSALNLFTFKSDTGPLKLRMKAMAYDILTQLFSAFDLRENTNPAALNYHYDIDAVFRIREQLLDIENSAYPTLDVLAKQAAMSPSKFKKVFHAVFGMSAFEFYQYHRLSYARHLIEGRNLAIKEVGLKIGYNNLSKFSQAYKRQFGYLPHQTLLPDRAML